MLYVCSERERERERERDDDDDDDDDDSSNIMSLRRHLGACLL